MTPQTIDSDEFYDPERDKYDALAAQGCRMRNQIKDKDREIFNLEAQKQALIKDGDSLRIALSDILCDYDKNGCVSKDVLNRVATILSTSLNFLMDRQEDDIAKLAPAALQAAFMEAYTAGLDIYISRDGAIYCINNKGKNEFIKEIAKPLKVEKMHYTLTQSEV